MFNWVSYRAPTAHFCFTAPLEFLTAPKGAVPSTLGTTGLQQRFPNFFWSRTICGPYIFTAYHLEDTFFQENSFYPISFDQKFSKPDLTQIRHEQNACEKL